MVMGHKVYGTFIAPGMGLRNNDPVGTAVDDQAEGQYWVINGLHYNDGCCFDYGNAETDSRDDGNGTMETTFLAALNTQPCFAGFCDWRIPSRAELMSITNIETYGPATFAAIASRSSGRPAAGV